MREFRENKRVSSLTVDEFGQYGHFQAGFGGFIGTNMKVWKISGIT